MLELTCGSVPTQNILEIKIKYFKLGAVIFPTSKSFDQAHVSGSALAQKARGKMLLHRGSRGWRRVWIMKSHSPSDPAEMPLQTAHN